MPLTIIKNTDNSIKVTFQENGTPINITGYSVLFTVKKDSDVEKSDLFALIKKDVTNHTSPLTGETHIVLSKTETDIPAGLYFWDIRVIKDGQVSQTSFDTLKITNNITQRTI